VLGRWRGLAWLERVLLLASSSIAVRRVQPGLLLQVIQVLAVLADAATARANLSLRDSAVGLGWPTADTLVSGWISLLHSETPTRSKYAS
jgi:hypothetical protein